MRNTLQECHHIVVVLSLRHPAQDKKLNTVACDEHVRVPGRFTHIAIVFEGQCICRCVGKTFLLPSASFMLFKRLGQNFGLLHDMHGSISLSLTTSKMYWFISCT